MSRFGVSKAGVNASAILVVAQAVKSATFFRWDSDERDVKSWG
jgi:hypothetical protein